MARPGGEETRANIRAAVRAIVSESGIAGFTLDGVAERVGVTRQAVLYHFKSRDRLLAEAVLDVLNAEAEALTAAAERAEPGLAGAASFLRDAIDWYLEDADRFRLLYALVQTSELIPSIDEDVLEARVYPVTGNTYSALERRLGQGPLPDGVDARKLGIALHMTALGVAAYQGVLARLGDSFRHDWHEVAGALAKSLARP